LIQEGLDEIWPEQVSKALDPFKQGHLIERPPIFYAGHLEHPIWSPSRALAVDAFGAGEEPGEAIVELEPDQGPPFGLITSQTCEIVEERPDPLQPWVQVAPVYCCDPALGLLDRDFVVRLDPPDLDGETWIADLRIEVAVEKGMLVGRDPIEAFTAEADYDELGNLLGQRRGRPALHSVFHNVLNVTMGEMKRESKTTRKTARRVRENVYKLKLAIEDGTRLAPVAAKLYIVTQGPPTEEAREWFDDWWNRAREVGAESGLELLPNGWLDAQQLEIDLERYESLIDVRNPLLS
jgi:hypothetical protein